MMIYAHYFNHMQEGNARNTAVRRGFVKSEMYSSFHTKKYLHRAGGFVCGRFLWGFIFPGTLELYMYGDYVFRKWCYPLCGVQNIATIGYNDLYIRLCFDPGFPKFCESDHLCRSEKITVLHVAAGSYQTVWWQY